ncbi:MAG: PTS sugar transporter subunit IIA [Fibrobacterota bacterium]
MNLTDILAPGDIFFSPSQTKGALFRELSRHFALYRDCSLTYEEIYHAFCEREREMTTGIGFGVAFPHGRPGELSQPAALFCKVSSGIADYAPLDGLPVRYVFALLTPAHEKVLHTELLCAAAAALRSKEVRRYIDRAQTSGEIYKLFASNAPETVH